MVMTDSPDYIKALLVPPTSGGGSRRAWSIDVESTWVPFFTATNVMGETTLPEEVLGAPIRLAKSPDGDVRFTKTGRPVMRVAPELNSQIAIENHPIRRYFDRGVLVTVNTDDPMMFGNSLATEYQALVEVHKFTRSDIQTLVFNGIQASWLSTDRKMKFAEEFAAEFKRAE